MTKINFHSIYHDPIDAHTCEGYWDGMRKDTPEPDSSRHPAYILGFRNGREDAGICRHEKTAQERRDALEYIRSVLGD